MSNDTSTSDSTNAGSGKRPMRTWVKVVIGVVVAAILAVTAGPFIYINFIKDDAPDRLTIDDAPIGDAGAATTGAATDTTATTVASAVESTVASPVESTVPADDVTTTTSTGTGATTAATTATTAPAADAASAGGADGTYALTADSQAGYRVVEVLFGQDTEGVGRTNSVTGSITILGTQVTVAEFTVDMTTLESDEDNRDRKFSGEIMETSEFPNATFVITQPIELGSIPADEEEITASATGDLTLHGVTKSVTLEVTAKKSGTSIAIAGSTDVVFSDYDIDNPSNGGITTEDHGLIEFLLVAVQS